MESEAKTWAAAPAGEDAWQPIETAPKNTKVLAAYQNELGNWRIVTACYHTELEWSEEYGDHDQDYAPQAWYEESDSAEVIYQTPYRPTHWRPLPAPPALSRKGSDAQTVGGGMAAGCVEEWYEGDEVAYLRDKLKQANERDRFYGVRITSEMVLREWFGGERYACDHEYLDANYGKQAQQVVDWLSSLAPPPHPGTTTHRDPLPADAKEKPLD